ncbi:MAG: family 10 glycosylhydrolase, partial [Thermoanaerobaculia bacterium]
WVETFNTPFGTQQDVLRIVDAAAQSNANALFVQVRRRGDSWYLDTKEPLTESAGFGEPDSSGRPTLDPLRYLIEQAHARAIEVHAFVIVGAVNRDDPATRVPADPRHVFLEHVWDRTAGAPYDGSRQWATRALPHNTTNTSYGGYRFGTEWYLDLGHPEAAAYTVDVLAHLVRQYAIDGIHLDRIRYPEAPIDAPRGINVGYNETSVARFKARFGSAARLYLDSDIGTGGITAADVGHPRTDDPLWSQWRRDQVTDFVRRLYLTVKTIRPAVRVSAALITFGSGPSAAGSFANTEPYWRVFQDWEGWARAGLVDLLVPMVYKRAHTTSEATAFDDWSGFTVSTAHANHALGLIGLGAYLNSVEGTIRQVRGARALGADGVVFYAVGSTIPGTTTSNSTNAAVASNPFSYPTAGLSTPKWPNSDFFSALRTGANGDGRTRFEAPSSTPLYNETAATPSLSPRTWVLGSVPNADGIEVVLEETGTHATHTTRTDGNGFWGFSGLPAGTWRATARLAAGDVTSCAYRVETGVAVTIQMSPCGPRRRAVGVR